MQKEISKIDKRLAQLRVDYVNASEGRKKLILSVAKLFKDKRAELVRLNEG